MSSGRCGLCGNKFGQRAEELVHSDCVDEMNRKYDRLRVEIDRLRSRDMATTALLRELEWCGFEDGWMGAFCFCPECRRSQDGGHDVDCRLGALLDEVKP